MSARGIGGPLAIFFILAACLPSSPGGGPDASLSEAKPTATPVSATTPGPEQTPSAECITPPVDVLTLAYQTDPLACYGGADLTLVATFTPGVGAIDCPTPLEPAWFHCSRLVALSGLPGTAIELDARLTARLRSGWELFALLHPDIDYLRYQLDGPVQVTGHYDDPAAQTCQYVEWTSVLFSQPPLEDVVFGCRSTFVIVAMERFDPNTLDPPPPGLLYLDFAKMFSDAGCDFSAVWMRFNQVPAQATPEEVAAAALVLASAHRTFRDSLAAVAWPASFDADARALGAALAASESALQAAAAVAGPVDYDGVVIPVVAAANRLRGNLGLPPVSGFGCERDASAA